MRKIVGLLSFVLCLVFLVNTFADGTVSYGMTKDNVISILGKPFETKQITSNVFGKLDILNYHDQKISRYNDATLSVGFNDNSVVLKMFTLPDNKFSRYDYLDGALQKKYGESTKDSDAVLAFFELIGYDTSLLSVDMLNVLVSYGNMKYNTWLYNNDEIIVLCNANTGSTSMTIIGYCQEQNASSINVDYDDTGL